MGEQAGATDTRTVIRYISSTGREAKLMLPWAMGQEYAPPPSIDFYDRALDQRVTFTIAGEV